MESRLYGVESALLFALRRFLSSQRSRPLLPLTWGKAHEHLRDLGVMMAGHDEGVPRVQLQDLLHLALCQREVKELEVLLHALLAGRLRYDDDTTL